MVRQNEVHWRKKGRLPAKRVFFFFFRRSKSPGSGEASAEEPISEAVDFTADSIASSLFPFVLRMWGRKGGARLEYPLLLAATKPLLIEGERVEVATIRILNRNKSHTIAPFFSAGCRDTPRGKVSYTCSNAAA